jgi:hypothetical protein
MKFFARPFLLAALLALPAPLVVAEDSPAPQAESPSPEANPSTDKEKSDAEEKPKADEFDIPVPIGPPIKGLRVPHYDEDGNLKFMFDAEIARKVDESHIEMENLKIDAYADDGKILKCLPLFLIWKLAFSAEIKVCSSAGKTSKLWVTPANFMPKRASQK